MHRSSQTSFLTLALVFVAASLQAQNGLLRGTVVDQDQRPLSDVLVTVTAPELSSYRKTLTTDKDGEFKLRFQRAQLQFLFDFQFEKVGYQSFSQAFRPTALQSMKETFVMDVSQSEVIESHGDLSSIVTGSSNEAIEAFNAGVAAQREGNLDAARTNLERAIESDPSLAPAPIALAQVLLDQGKHAEALAAADMALELVPGSVEAIRVRYQALRALGRQQEADEMAARLEQAEGATAAARRIYNEGGEAFKADDRGTALAKFREAAKLDPSLIDAHHAVATLELAAGNFEASAEAAKQALAQGSEDVRTLRVLYDAYDALGRTEDLVEIAPRLAAVDPDFGGSKLVEQAAELWNTGETERAVALAKLALAVDPKLAKPYYFLGLKHLSDGQNAEARTALEKFIALDPEDAEVPTAKEMLSYIE